MKTFISEGEAHNEISTQRHIFILKYCPFNAKNFTLCSSKCPHFFINEADKEIYITCSGAEVLLGNLDE